jgi:hypothetical protein
MIDGLTYFAWAVMAIILVILTALFVFLGSLPKKIADKHNHPQAAAINAASWLGLFLGGIGWPFALVWAYTKSGNAGYSDAAHSAAGDRHDKVPDSTLSPSPASETKSKAKNVEDKPASK